MLLRGINNVAAGKFLEGASARRMAGWSLVPHYVLQKLRGDITKADAMDGYLHGIDSAEVVERIAAHLMERWGA